MGKNPRLIEDGGERDAELDKLRSVALQCTNAKRLQMLALGLLFDGELNWASDYRRLYVGPTFIGPSIRQPDTASQAEMLALNESNPSGRGVNRGDTTYRSDTDSVWECLAGNGTELAQWYDRGTAGSDAVAAGYYEPVANGDIDSPENIFAAGDAVVAFVET